MTPTSQTAERIASLPFFVFSPKPDDGLETLKYALDPILGVVTRADLRYD